MGSEYFSVGYFNGRHKTINTTSYVCAESNCPNEKDCCPFQQAQNYVWQIAMPAYAQATTSLWSELLFDGELLIGDMPVARLSQGCDHPACDYSSKFPQKQHALLNQTHWPAPVNWRFWTGSQDVAVYIRKHTREPASHVVVGSIQPQSNYVGNADISVNVTVQLDPGTKLTFEVRRQGSTYALAMAPGGGVQSFVQLDKWHSHKHPSFWPREFSLEGELHDQSRLSTAAALASSGVHTENIATVTAQSLATSTVTTTTHYDMRAAVSYVRLTPAAQRAWTFEPRPVDPISGLASSTREFALVVRGRSTPTAAAKHTAGTKSSTDGKGGAAPACVDLAVARNVRESHPQAQIDAVAIAEAEPLGRVCVDKPEWEECLLVVSGTLSTNLEVTTGAKHALVARAVREGGEGDGAAGVVFELDWLRLVQVGDSNSFKECSTV